MDKKTKNINEMFGELAYRLRSVRKMSRGQMAVKLNTSPSVIFNFEKGRSRIPLDLFFKMIDSKNATAEEVIYQNLFTLQDVKVRETHLVIKAFRKRLNMTQKQLGEKLGFKSSAMVHHFEKGLRRPSVADFFQLMKLAGDNSRGLVEALTHDKKFAKKFPSGKQATQIAWKEYWSQYYIPAIRQILRTATFHQSPSYQPGMFTKILGINQSQEDYAIDVLTRLKIIRLENHRISFNSEIGIVLPKDIDKSRLNQIKRDWVRFSALRELNQKGENFLTTDLIPINQVEFAKVIEKIRELQSEIHNIKVKDADGFMVMNYLGSYVLV